MNQSKMALKLSVQISKQGKRFVVWSPALDLSTSGRSVKEAQRRFEQAVEIFFEELASANTTDAVLVGLGWKRVQKSWQAPKVVKEKTVQINIPVMA